MTNMQILGRVLVIAIALYILPNALATGLLELTNGFLGFRTVSLDFFRFFAYVIVLAGIAMFVFGGGKKS